MRLTTRLNRPYKALGSIVDIISVNFILEEEPLDRPLETIDPIRWSIANYLSNLVESNSATKVVIL